MFDERQSYATAELLETVRQTAGKLAEAGIRCGEYVGLSGTRTIEAVILFLSLQKLGAVAVLCDPHQTSGECVRSSGAAVALSHAIDFVSGGWVLDGQPFAVEKAPLHGTPDPLGCEGDYNAPAYMIFTSGSTGQTKGVVLSQYNYINHQRNFSGIGGYLEHDTAIQMLPLFHIFGMTQLVDVLIHHCPLYFPDEVTPDSICQGIEKHGVTRFAFVPSFALKMAEIQKERHYRMETLKVVVLAGAPSTREQFNFLEETLGIRIVPCYGMSECPGISGSGPEEPAEKRASSVGKILPMTEVQIADDGEICVKGPGLFLGYAGEEPVDRNAFFPTGDLGFLDEEGYLHITGRKKDIIIRNGNNLSAAAIERKLLSLPFIHSAAVVGIPDASCGEVPVALVKLKKNAVYDKNAVEALLNRLELPKEIRVVDELPLNAAGKIDKQGIKELFA